MIHFTDNDAKPIMVMGSKSGPSLTRWMLIFNTLEFLGHTCLEVRWMPNPMVTTAPESSLMGNQQCLVVSYSLFVIVVGTASFTRIVEMAIVTAWLIYRQVPGTDALDLLDFKHPAPVLCCKQCISWQQAGWPFVSVCWSHQSNAWC